MKPLQTECEEIISEYTRSRGQPALDALKIKHELSAGSQGLQVLLAVARELAFAAPAPAPVVISTPTPPIHAPKKSFESVVREFTSAGLSKSAAIAAAIDQKPELYSDWLTKGGGTLA